MGLQEQQQAVEEAAQAALEASSAAEAQHAAGSKQLAADKRNLQQQQDQVRRLHVTKTHCLSEYAAVNSTSFACSVSSFFLILTAQKPRTWCAFFVL